MPKCTIAAQTPAATYAADSAAATSATIATTAALAATIDNMPTVAQNTGHCELTHSTTQHHTTLH